MTPSPDPLAGAAAPYLAAITRLRARRERAHRFTTAFVLGWLVWLAWPIADLLGSGRPAGTVAWGIGLTVVFVAVYGVGATIALGERGRAFPPRAATLVLTAIALAQVPVLGTESAPYLMFTAALSVFAWPRRVWLPAIVVFTAWAAVLPELVGAGQTPRWFFPALIAAHGLLMPAVARMRAQSRELERAHEQLAELAVAEERLRFGRDLHDILGHSLTSIVVKAQLAGRLVDRDLDRLRDEITDIERLAREGLADVRSTAAGYREVTLATELVAARSALSAAGVHADLPHAVDQVPGTLRELFGWAVREGVTNVVRHSGAHWCQIRLGPDSVEVLDDGVGPGGEPGTGLRGLADRAASCGAVLEMTARRPSGASLVIRRTGAGAGTVAEGVR